MLGFFIHREGEATGMLPLQAGAHKDSLLFVPQTSMQQSYDIFAKKQRGGEFFLREGREMLNVLLLHSECDICDNCDK